LIILGISRALIRLGLAMMKVLKLNNEVKIMLVKGDGGGMVPGMYYVSVAQWPEARAAGVGAAFGYLIG